MVVVASLRNHNIYTPFGDQKANRGPTPFCIFLKVVYCNLLLELWSDCFCMV